MISTGPSWLPRTQTRRKSVAVGIAANDFQTGEMPLGQPLEVQIVEDVAIDHELVAVLDGPDQKLLEQLRLADVAAQVQVADHETIVVNVISRGRA